MTEPMGVVINSPGSDIPPEVSAGIGNWLIETHDCLEGALEYLELLKKEPVAGMWNYGHSYYAMGSTIDRISDALREIMAKHD